MYIQKVLLLLSFASTAYSNCCMRCQDSKIDSCRTDLDMIGCILSGGDSQAFEAGDCLDCAVGCPCDGCGLAGTGAGDPIIYGFDGGWFHFQGTGGKIFNLISDAHVQLNSRFTPDPNFPDEMTWLGDVGIMVGEDRFDYFLDGQKVLNGKTLSPSIVGLADGGKLTVWEEAVAFEIPNYEIYIKILPSPRHFNVHADYIVGPGSSPHGVLGQTADGVMRLQDPEDPEILETYLANGVLICYGLHGEGCIEGTADDYEINSEGLFGTDFTFNCFNGTHTQYKPRDWSAYQHRLAHAFDKQPGFGDDPARASGVLGGTADEPRKDTL